MSTQEEAYISVNEDGAAVTITGGGSLTLFNANEFGERLKQASLTAESVTVDLRPAVFIDSKIVQDLGQAAVMLIKRGKRLRVLMDGTAYPLHVAQDIGLRGDNGYRGRVKCYHKQDVWTEQLYVMGSPSRRLLRRSFAPAAQRALRFKSAVRHILPGSYACGAALRV